MIVTLHREGALDGVRRELTRRGIWIDGVERTSAGDVHILISACSSYVPARDLERLDGVRSVSMPASPHPRVDAHGPQTRVGDIPIGPRTPVVIAGPCAVESPEQIERIAARVSELGVRFLRGGAFKPRTSPYSFHGHGRAALTWLRDAADRHRMKVVTEVMSEQEVGTAAEHADVVQIGSRNMQNFALLRAVGRRSKPVLLKRSMSATVEEWLLAGEHLLSHGATGLLFCERGIRNFDDNTRNLLDLGAVALLAHVHGLPVVVDPSHGTGRRELVPPLARAALAAGASGVMIEVHDDPGAAESDGAQALHPLDLRPLVEATRRESA